MFNKFLSAIAYDTQSTTVVSAKGAGSLGMRRPTCERKRMCSADAADNFVNADADVFISREYSHGVASFGNREIFRLLLDVVLRIPTRSKRQCRQYTHVVRLARFFSSQRSSASTRLRAMLSSRTPSSNWLPPYTVHSSRAPPVSRVLVCRLWRTRRRTPVCCTALLYLVRRCSVLAGGWTYACTHVNERRAWCLISVLSSALQTR